MKRPEKHEISPKTESSKWRGLAGVFKQKRKNNIKGEGRQKQGHTKSEGVAHERENQGRQ